MATLLLLVSSTTFAAEPREDVRLPYVNVDGSRGLSSGNVRDIAFRPDGGQLAVSHLGPVVYLFDTKTGEMQRVFEDVNHTKLTSSPLHGREVRSLAYSPDGKWLAFGQIRTDEGGKDRGAVRVVEVATGKEVWQSETPAMVNGIAFSPKGKLLVARLGSHLVGIWDAATGRERHTLRRRGSGAVSPSLSYHGIGFRPDGRELAVVLGGHNVVVWDPVTGEERRHVAIEPGRGVALAFAWSRDGKLWAVARNEFVEIREATSGDLLRTLEDEGRVVSVAFDPDGKRLVAGSRTPHTRLWNVETGELLTEWGTSEDDNLVAFGPNGRRVATGVHTDVKLWQFGE